MNLLVTIIIVDFTHRLVAVGTDSKFNATQSKPDNYNYIKKSNSSSAPLVSGMNDTSTYTEDATQSMTTQHPSVTSVKLDSFTRIIMPKSTSSVKTSASTATTDETTSLSKVTSPIRNTMPIKSSSTSTFLPATNATTVFSTKISTIETVSRTEVTTNVPSTSKTKVALSSTTSKVTKSTRITTSMSLPEATETTRVEVPQTVTDKKVISGGMDSELIGAISCICVIIVITIIFVIICVRHKIRQSPGGTPIINIRLNSNLSYSHL